MFLAECEKEIGAMLRTQETHGLCSTCNNASGCFYLSLRGPALFCELFDNYVPAAVLTERKSGPSMAGPFAPTTALQDEASQFTGLCVNCENRQTCRHPKPAGGVWHCEEYQ